MKRTAWIAIGLATIIAIGLYLAGLPIVADVPGWFYRPEDKHIGLSVYVGVAALLVPMSLALALRMAARGRTVVPLALLVTSATMAQLGVTAIGGEDEVWERHALGHSTFFTVAVERQDDIVATLRNYEALARGQHLGVFGPTKPPGTLLSYMALVKLGEIEALHAPLIRVIKSARGDGRVKDHAEAAAVSVFVMPLFTALTILPLFFLALSIFGDRAVGFASGVVYLSAPSVLLITYHLDGALFPLLGITACALLAHGARRDRFTISVLGGAVACLGLYASFSLIPVLPIAAGVVCVISLDRARRERFSLKRAAYGAGWHLLAGAAGFFAVLFALSSALGFDLPARLDTALDYHEWWKRGVPTLLWRAMSLVELALYVGLPLSALFIHRSVASVGGLAKSLAKRTWTVRDVMGAGMLALVSALAASQGTNEVARMWLFLVPFIALIVSSGLADLTPVRVDAPSAGIDNDGAPFRLTVPLLALAFAQALIAVVMKGYQDW